MLSLFRRQHLSDAHLALLSLFLKPRGLDSAGWQQSWSEAMAEPYSMVIKSFWDRGYLQKATPLESASICTVAELKAALREAGLRVGGRKDELLERLAQGAPVALTKLAEKHPVLICTELGRKAAQPWTDRIHQARQDTDATVAAALRSGAVEQAAHAISAFRQLLPAPMRGVLASGVSSEGGLCEHVALLRCIGVPELLAMPTPADTDSDVFAEYRIQAATDWLWGRRIAGPLEFRSVAYRAAFGAVAREKLKEYEGSDVVKGVRVSAAHDACESCKRLAAGGPYTFDQAPIVPNPDCTNAWCRCIYSPWMKSWEELGIHGV
jgi:hypothetical protein